MWEYSEKLKEYFLHPKNVGEIENPDAVGEVGSLICGDAFKIPETPKAKKKTYQFAKDCLNSGIIEKEIRPRLQADGRDLELIDIDGNRVIVALRAMCVECPMSEITISNIQEKLRELVDENIIVEAT